MAWWKRALRVIIAAGIALILQNGLKLIFPSTNIFAFVRYFFVILIPMGILPFAFKKEKEEAHEQIN